MSVWIGQILYMEMNPSTIAASKSISVTIPTVRGAEDVSVPVAAAIKVTAESDTEGLADGDTDGATEGTTEGSVERNCCRGC